MVALASGLAAGVPTASPATEAAGVATTVTLVLVGDTGLGGSEQPVHAERATRHGTRHAFEELTRDIAGEIDGDLAFANLETVVTDRNDLRARRKAYVFRMHPDGLAHLVARGFNLFSTANNHAGDYGTEGILETIAHLEALRPHRIKAAAGVGKDRGEAGRPVRVDIKGRRIVLSAIGIGGGRTNEPGRPPRPGQMAYSETDDFREVVQRLGAADGYRILSAHYGAELDVTPDPDDADKLRDEAVREAGIDLVVGHHAHVAAGMQEIDGKLIFYGLGNFLHLGTQDMSRLGPCRDYGLLARVHLSAAPGGKLAARAIEVVPLTGMHLAPKPMAAEQATRRIGVLNKLARGLDVPAAHARGVRFAAQPDGSGLYCLAGAEDESGRIGKLCRDWPERSAALEAAGEAGGPSCGHARPQYARDRDRRGGRRAKRRQRSASDDFFKNLFGN
jgi:poly-gamma-glutamate synthesis protein (capsule biosynthesis protein)